MNESDLEMLNKKTTRDCVSVEGTELRPGDRVRIAPKSRADIMDIALRGRIGVIEAIEEDAEGKIHLALVIEDDPGSDMGMMRQSGHRFFYALQEIELIDE